MTMTEGKRAWLTFATHCMTAALCMTALPIMINGWRGWTHVGSNLLLSFIFTFQIGSLAWMIAPPLARRIWDWNPVLRWSVLIASLLVIAAAGTVLAVALVQLIAVAAMALGGSLYRPFLEPFGGVYLEALRIAVPVTLFIGVLTTVVESSKERLRNTELMLRNQQLERERAEKLAAEAQLASLTSRVHPHFLFNTLNSIAALVKDDPQQAEQTIEQLSSLLRGSLDPAQAIPVERELKLVSDYLEIQKIRFGPRLVYTMDWQPAALNGGTVPPFAVQTLVENALKHAGGQRQEGVILELRAHREGAELFIDVTDNGPGFAPDAIQAGHGLDNLQSRLRGLYGDRGGIEFLRSVGKMTVRLRVPA